MSSVIVPPAVEGVALSRMYFAVKFAAGKAPVIVDVPKATVNPAPDAPPVSVPVEVIEVVTTELLSVVPVNPVLAFNPVPLVNVIADGVPPAPLSTTGAPALPTLIARAVATPVPKPVTLPT